MHLSEDERDLHIPYVSSTRTCVNNITHKTQDIRHNITAPKNYIQSAQTNTAILFLKINDKS